MTRVVWTMGGEAGVVVADHRAGHEGDHHEDGEDREDGHGLGQREGRVEVGGAAAADGDPLDGDGGEGEEEEEGGRHPEQR
ncbi:MAG: hypothetical protein QM767_27295 [Anaeromyxobacter sp.]